MARMTRLDSDGRVEQLLQAFATVAQLNGCRSLFKFVADSNVVCDARDFEFAVRLFFYEVDSKERASFDLHVAGQAQDEFFAWVGVAEEFEPRVVQEATASLGEMSCLVTGFSLPL